MKKRSEEFNSEASFQSLEKLVIRRMHRDDDEDN